MFSIVPGCEWSVTQVAYDGVKVPQGSEGTLYLGLATLRFKNDYSNFGEFLKRHYTFSVHIQVNHF